MLAFARFSILCTHSSAHPESGSQSSCMTKLFSAWSRLARCRVEVLYPPGLLRILTPVIFLQTVVPLLACQRVDGQVKWLVTDMSVQCWEGLHLLVTSSVLVPAVLFNLLPMCLALVVRRCFPRAFEVYFPLWSAG